MKHQMARRLENVFQHIENVREGDAAGPSHEWRGQKRRYDRCGRGADDVVERVVGTR